MGELFIAVPGLNSNKGLDGNRVVSANREYPKVCVNLQTDVR